jgi:hypothetical protein
MCSISAPCQRALVSAGPETRLPMQVLCSAASAKHLSAAGRHQGVSGLRQLGAAPRRRLALAPAATAAGSGGGKVVWLSTNSQVRSAGVLLDPVYDKQLRHAAALHAPVPDQPALRISMLHTLLRHANCKCRMC